MMRDVRCNQNHEIFSGQFSAPEGEWEYFTLAGTTTPFSCNETSYNGSNCYSCTSGTHPTLEQYCWYCANSGYVGTQRAGSFVFSAADWPDPPVEECNGVEFLITESEAEIFVFTERDYLLRINMPEHYRNFAIRTGWVKERLRYIRLWWGRIRASDVIIDVENERMVYSETTNSGLHAFQQWNPETE